MILFMKFWCSCLILIPEAAKVRLAAKGIINVACTQPSVSSYSAADDLQPAFWDAAS
jgi:hypothetical protein